MVHPFILGYKQGAWYIFYHLCSLLCWIKIFNFVEHLTSETGVCHLFERKKESNLELQWKLFSSTKKSLFGCSATFRPWFSLAGDCESGKMASGHSSLGKVCKLQYSQQWLNGSLILSPVMFS